MRKSIRQTVCFWYLIRDVIQEGACIDSFGVGERLITAKSEPVFGGVYKLSALEKDGELIPKIKISENVEKITNPGFKTLYRLFDRDSNRALADVIVLDGEGLDEEKVMEDCFDAGADDFERGDDVVEVTCSPDAFSDVRQKLEEKGYTFISAEVEMVPSTTTPITDPDAQVQMAKLLDALDDDDDVQNVWHNLENEEDLDR